jgi:O-antigen ligase
VTARIDGSVTLLATILFGGILTMWIPDRWALSCFQLALFAMAVLGLVRAIRVQRPLEFPSTGVLLAAAAAWGVVQVFAATTVYQLRTLESALDWLTSLTAFSLAYGLGQRPEQRRRFLNSTLLFAAALGIVSIFTVLTSPVGRVFWLFDVSDARTLGPFVYKNQYAAFVEAVLPLAILAAIRDRKRWVPYTLLAAILFGSVIASGSRTGSALCLAEVIAVPLFAFARRQIGGRTLARAVLGSLAAMALLTLVVGWQVIWERLQEANPYALRWKLVQASVAMVRDRPWMGFGLGTWPAVYPAYALYDDGSFVNQAHNDWLQWAVEGGVPFFAMMLAIAAWTIRPAARSLWGIGLLAVFLHCLIDYPMQQRPALAAFFFALLGILAGECRTTGVPRTSRTDSETFVPGRMSS